MSDLTPDRQDTVIEEVTPDSMKIKVNNEITEIKNTFDEMKLFFEKLNIKDFTSGGKIYNIGTITNAVFSNEIGKKTLNMFFCRQITEAIKEYNPDAKKLLENTIKEPDRKNWETKQTPRNDAFIIIKNGFAGALSIMLGKLISSGRTSFDKKDPKDYLEVCIATAKRSLQLLSYSFLSKLWDYQPIKKFEYTDDQLNVLNSFFNNESEYDINDNLQLLKTLVNIFDTQQIQYPFIEFKNEYLEEDNPFLNACKKLGEINTKLDYGTGYEFSIVFEAENVITEFLKTLSFFAKYKMVSMKDILYEEVRGKDAQYLLSYTFLGVDNESVIKKANAAKLKYDKVPINSNAVFIFRNKYHDGLNLFPFIIDENALIVDEKKTRSSEVKICFYISYKESDEKLIYSDIHNISSVKSDSSDDFIDPTHVPVQYNEKVENELTDAVTDNDITDLKDDYKKYNSLQLNAVYKIFQKAKKEILALPEKEIPNNSSSQVN